MFVSSRHNFIIKAKPYYINIIYKRIKLKIGATGTENDKFHGKKTAEIS